MSDAQETGFSIVDVLAFLARYRVALVAFILVGAVVAAGVVFLVPPNLVDSVYSEQDVVTMRVSFHRLQTEVRGIISEPEYRLRRWTTKPELLGEAFVAAGYDFHELHARYVPPPDEVSEEGGAEPPHDEEAPSQADLRRLGQALMRADVFASEEDSGDYVFTVAEVDLDRAITLLTHIGEESLRSAAAALVSQSNRYIERVRQQYSFGAGDPIPNVVPEQVRLQLLALVPYTEGAYDTSCIQPDPPELETITHDDRRRFAAIALAAFASLGAAGTLVHRYAETVRADEIKMARLRQAWTAGRLFAGRRHVHAPTTTGGEG